MRLHMSLKFVAGLIMTLAFVIGCALGHGQDSAGASASASASQSANAPTAAPKPGTPDPATAPTPAKAPVIPDPYPPSHDQALELENLQLKAQLAQSAYAAEAQKLPSFAQFQQSVTALQQGCVKVRAANHWPESVQCDIQQVPVKFCAKLPCAVPAVK